MITCNIPTCANFSAGGCAAMFVRIDNNGVCVTRQELVSEEIFERRYNWLCAGCGKEIRTGIYCRECREGKR